VQSAGFSGQQARYFGSIRARGQFYGFASALAFSRLAGLDADNVKHGMVSRV
jgi:hypothetical protein